MLVAVVCLIGGFALGVGAAIAASWYRRRGAPDRPASRWPVVTVPVTGSALPETALTAGAQVAGALHARLVLLSPVQVPRTLSRDAESVPGLEKSLARAEAAEQFVRRLGAEAYGEVVRVRELAEVIDRACSEVGSGLVILEAKEGGRGAQELFHTVTERTGQRGFDVLLASSRTGTAPGQSPEKPAGAANR
jgi:hypothetical protein